MLTAAAPGTRLSLMVERLEELLDGAIELLPVLAIAVAVVVASWLIARLVTRGDLLFRWAGNSLLRDVARQIVRSGLVIAGIVIALELLGATALVGAVLGAAGVFGIAVGFAFRDLVENYIAGVLLSLRQPFAPSDHVVVNGHEGTVMRLTSRATILLTADGNHLRLPNALVFKGVILNYSRNPMRRFGIELVPKNDADLAAAGARGVAVLERIEAVSAEPPPSAEVFAQSPSTLGLRFFAWVDQDRFDFAKTRSEALRLVELAIDAPELEASATRDTSIDRALEAQIASERRTEPDLLSASAPRE